MPSAGICRYDGALDAATAAVDIGATNAAAHQFLAGLYFMDDRFAEAERHWQTAFRLAHEAGEHCAAAGAAINLSGLHTSYSGPDATGRGWLERARIELEQVGPCVEWGYLELAAASSEGHPHAHHDRRDRTRHLPLLDPRTGGRTGRVHVQPVPRP
jgi:tetratricopeptide (TPR) repeat protein